MYLENFQAKLDWRVPALFLLLLLPFGHYNFTFFHTLVESVAVIVAILAFVVAFNTYPFSQSHFLMYLGCGYFWVGILDFFHTISFPGFSVFEDARIDISVQFWLMARLLEAFVLLSFTLFARKELKRHVLFLSFAVVATLCLLLAYSQILPALYVTGQGLTQTKVFAEYLVIGILFVAGWHLWRQRDKINASIYKLFMISIGLTIAAEFSFSIRLEDSEFLVICGHVLKLTSFWLIYVALVESTLTQPFKSLSLSSDTFNALPDAIVVVDKDGQILHVNDSARAFTCQSKELVGGDVHKVFHSQKTQRAQCGICQSIGELQTVTDAEVQRDGKWYQVNLSSINYYGEDNVLLHISRDITISKEAQLNFQTANKLYTVLRLTNKAIISSKTKQDLLDSVCDIAVNHGGFAMAWIGMIEGDEVIPVSSMGDSSGYLDDIQVRIDDSRLAKGPVGIAIKGHTVACVNHIESDPCFSPWRDRALACGYKSIAAVPVIQFGECVGIFVIYANDDDAFDAQTLELLSSLSDDISSILAFIQAEEKRLAAETKLSQLSRAIEQSKSAVVITDTKANIEYVNPFYTELTGYLEHEVLGCNMHDFPRLDSTRQLLDMCLELVLRGTDWHGEVESLRKNGETYWGLQSVSPIVDNGGKITHIVWTAEDNTELHNAHETISHLAYFDALTGLPNRRLYHDRFNQAISAAKRHKTRLAVLYFDLDNFKMINDSLGHDFGDVLLKHVGGILTNAVREMDTVSRLGGDEFSIIVNDVVDDNQVTHVADHILHQLNKKTVLQGRELSISTSIGVSMYPTDGDNAKELMKNADMAMYHAKEKGKNNFQFFEEFLNINAQHRLQMEDRIRKAIDEDVFQLYYQPQFDIHNGVMSGVEALIRWPDGDGFISPCDFIPIAEETSLIIDIGNWVVKQACHEFKQLIDDGFPAVKVAVNISAGQFHQPRGLMKAIDDALTSSGLPNHLLQLELTEGVLIDDVTETISFIDKLKKKNISFAIDDFGTGYSSLSYLKSFPVDIIKIDRSFVMDIETDVNDQAIIRAISVMAHALDLKVLAEGVETEAQLAFLREHQCDFVQGYYYAKPMPGAKLLSEYGV